MLYTTVPFKTLFDYTVETVADFIKMGKSEENIKKWLRGDGYSNDNVTLIIFKAKKLLKQK